MHTDDAAQARSLLGLNRLEETQRFILRNFDTIGQAIRVDAGVTLRYETPYVAPSDRPSDIVGGVVHALARREAATQWLADMAQRGKHFGKVEKFSDDYSFGVRVTDPKFSWNTLFRAAVDAEVACILEPTGEVEEVEVREYVTKGTEMRPVMAKHCPPSLLASALDAVTV